MLYHVTIVAALLYTGRALTTCDTSQYSTCQYNFNLLLNLTEPQPYHNPENFRKSVENLYQLGSTLGLRQVCRAFREFKSCLGDQYSSCISVPWLAQTNVKPQAAYEFVKIYMQFHYICGAGFNTYMNIDDCMTATWKASKQKLDNCRYQFDAQIAEDQTDACFYGTVLIRCFQNEFKRYCSSRPDAQWWACEYCRTGIFTQFPHCSTVCSYP